MGEIVERSPTHMGRFRCKVSLKPFTQRKIGAKEMNNEIGRIKEILKHNSGNGNPCYEASSIMDLVI
jgi:hypothetical protein